MRNIFFISDTHFGHENACTKFKRNDGSPLRNFSCAAECDEYMVERWNLVVKPGDRVYHLGDVTMSRKHLPTLNRLNGDKVLIRGNHDEEPAKEYLKYFEDVRALKQMKDLIATHIPIHPESLARWQFNVHGHLHANRVLDTVVRHGTLCEEIDHRYLCVSVEQIDYTPISFEDVMAYRRKHLEH